MKRTIAITLGLAAALLVAGASSARAYDTARWWLVPGGQVTWPSDDLGLEERALGPGLIAGFKVSPNWALEARVHYGKFEPRSGIGDESKLVHGEGNLSFFLDPTLRLSPYLTAGVGTVDASGPLDGQEFAWNAGFGFLYHFNEKIALRVDARNLSFRHPVTASSEWLESEEVFAGLSFGMGGEKTGPSDEDGDGVIDPRDRCPNTPRGARVDAEGCPRDSDGDGVWDGLDECPKTPADTPVDRRGCPISKKEDELLKTGMIRLDNVYFDTDRATIKRESHEVLDEVAEILNRYDDLKIEIGGHTDSRGTEAYNEELSDARAKAVLDYLVSKHNLSRGRFSARGYGESKPVGSNDSEAGMAKNRRVEFKVMNPEALKR